jgi:uncharacterized membrane protein
MSTFADPGRDAVGPIRLADGLGVASIALGARMLTAPRRFLRAIGATDGSEARRVVLGVGARELVAAFTILGMRHRRVGAWSRVGGDTMDAALLLHAMRQDGADRARLLRALGIAGAIMAVDAFTAVRLTRAEVGATGAGSDGEGMAPVEDEGPLHVRTAVTIGKGADEVHQAFRTYEWQAFDAENLEAEGAVRFTPAPGEQGTEVHIDWTPPRPGGPLGTVVAKVRGNAPDQQVHDDLRRFKMLLETGVVSRSDKTPEGPDAGRQILQRSGQPSGGTA